MKDNGDQAKIGAAMVKGEAPFDLAKVHKIFCDVPGIQRLRPLLCSRRTQ
jgi:hypothetical protein